MPPKGDQQAQASGSTEPLQLVEPTNGQDDSEQSPKGSHTPVEDSLPDQLAATQARIKQLEELTALRKKADELQAALIRGVRQRQSLESGSEDDRSDIKIKNITVLTTNATFRKRDDWLNDLRRAFEGAPRKFRKDSKKILLANDNMDANCHARWDRYLDEQTDSRRKSLAQDWNAFKEWSLTLIKEAANLQPHITLKIQNAMQRAEQSPTEFHAYLDSLEKHLPRADEKT